MNKGNSVLKSNFIRIIATTIATAMSAGSVFVLTDTPSHGFKNPDTEVPVARFITTPNPIEEVTVVPLGNVDITGSPLLPDTNGVQPETGEAIPVETPSETAAVEQPREVDEEPYTEPTAEVHEDIQDGNIDDATTEEPVPYEEQPANTDDNWCYEEPVYTYPSIPEAVGGEGGMTDEFDELTMAHEIFDRYNEWRSSQGLAPATWDGVCAEMAVNSAKGCATQKKLVHRLGIPEELQTSYSDILQMATWRMSGEEAVQRWENSEGHKRQMLCPTVQNGACGVYYEGGTYWFAIVYTFQGTNVA